MKFEYIESRNEKKYQQQLANFFATHENITVKFITQVTSKATLATTIFYE